MIRSQWTSLAESDLLSQCQVDTYRASGPGGQKRNKTSSAVRLRHPPSGLIVIAEESRSQHQNKAKAMKRLYQALFLKIRETVPSEEEDSQWLSRNLLWNSILQNGRLHLGRKDNRFWPAVGLILDVLEKVQGRLSDTSRFLQITTGNLVSFLQTDPKVWEQANIIRSRFGQKAIK
jgi:hypothetical protein